MFQNASFICKGSLCIISSWNNVLFHGKRATQWSWLLFLATNLWRVQHVFPHRQESSSVPHICPLALRLALAPVDHWWRWSAPFNPPTTSCLLSTHLRCIPFSFVMADRNHCVVPKYPWLAASFPDVSCLSTSDYEAQLLAGENNINNNNINANHCFAPGQELHVHDVRVVARASWMP